MQIIRAFMEHLIDYAGLFPPAKLDMPAAVCNYSGFLRSDHAWMLARFIVPVARLEEFLSSLPATSDDERWRLSALTAPADDVASLEPDLDAIESFNRARRGRAVIDAIELKAHTGAAIEAALELIPDEITPFFELPLERDVRGMVAAISGEDACAKARTGGVTPDLFPSPAALANFIAVCAAADVPFKATAGLHHPFRHDSATVAGAKEFGFFNVFLAGALAMRDRLDTDQLTDLLADENRDHFTFTDERIAWKNHEFTIEQIEEARLSFAMSYGSCSFLEPIDDLRSMKLLPA